MKNEIYILTKGQLEDLLDKQKQLCYEQERQQYNNSATYAPYPYIPRSITVPTKEERDAAALDPKYTRVCFTAEGYFEAGANFVLDKLGIKK